jgi:hypothetical protein
VLHKPLGDDRRHEFIRTVDALAAIEPQRECDRVDEVFRRGWREAIGVVWHSPS